LNTASTNSADSFGYTNCWIHAGLHSLAIIGSPNVPGLSGGANRVGGLFAKGTPKNLLTVAVAVGSEVVVPTTTPESMVAVGPPPGYPQAL
jgi:hypothetical protein